MHPLLRRQLRRLGLDEATPPSDVGVWQTLLTRVDATYRGADDDRYTLERAFDISSKEMTDLYGQLERATQQELGLERDKAGRSVAILEATLETMEDGVLVVGRDGRVILFNRRFLELWRVPEELVARASDADIMAHCIGQVAASQRPPLAPLPGDDEVGTPSAREDELRLVDGRQFHAYSATIATDSGPIGRMWIFRDETERLKRETEIRQGQRFLEAILENLPDMVFVKDAATLRFVAFNRAGEELIGVSREHLIGKGDYDFFPPEQSDAFTARDRQVIADGLLNETEEPISAAIGERLLHTKKIPIFDDAGRPKFLLGIARDITESRRRQVELQAAKEAAERASRAKGDFLSNMSHELRTPLNGILGFAEMLGHPAVGALNPRQRGCLDDIRRAGTHMAHLVDDLLDLRRIEDDRIRPELGYHALGPIAQDAEALLRPLVDERRQTLTVRITDERALLQCNPQALLQVLLNLLSNAVKYTDRGGHITLEAARRGVDVVEIAVSDNGIGIAPMDLPKLFTYFTQLGAKVEHHMRGSGVGLALTRALIEQMGGTIEVESVLGRGSTFRVRLRARPDRSALRSTAITPTSARRDSWCYLAEADDGEALTKTLLAWRANAPEAGVLALVPANDIDAIPRLQSTARSLGMPIVGSVFPELIVDGDFQERGVLLMKLDPMPPHLLLSGLGRGAPDLERATDDAIQQLATLAESATRTQGRSTLWMVFDGLLGNVGSLVDALYLQIGDLVHYTGVCGGTMAYKPTPILFDRTRIVDQGVLAMVLPDHPGGVVHHGYSVEASHMVATSANGNRIAHIDWAPAFDKYRAMVRAEYGVDVDREAFFESAVHFPFALLRADGEAIVRLPSGVGGSGEINFVSDVPPGTVLTVARGPAAGHTQTATHIADELGGREAMVFYCGARRVHFGRDEALAELTRIGERGAMPLVGALSLGELGDARQGGYPVFHNAAVAALPWSLGGKRP